MKKLFTFKFNAITNDFNVIIFYHLFGCPKLNFEPLTKRESHTPSVNHCAIFEYHQEPHNEVKQSASVGFELGTRLDSDAQSHFATLPSTFTLSKMDCIKSFPMNFKKLLIPDFPEYL